MYNVSEAYKKASNSSTRESRVYGTLTKSNGAVINFTSADILGGSLSVDNAAVNGQELNLGTVYSGRMQFSLKTDADRYSLYNSEINLTYSLRLQDGTWEDVPIGIFTISEAQRSGGHVSMTGYDKMLNFDDELNLRTNGTPYELTLFCCNQCGVEMAQTEEEFNKFSSNSAYKYGIPTETTLSSYRALLSEIAIIMGGFFIIDRFGKLKLCRFGEKQSLNITDRLNKKADIYDYKCSYSGILAVIDGANKLTGTAEKSVINIGELSLLKNGLNFIKENTLINIYNSIKDLEYTPCSIEYIGDPALDLGDIIQISGHDADNNNGTYMVIMTYNWKFHGTHKLTAVGENIRLAKVKTVQTNKQTSSVNSIVSDAQMKTFTYTNASDISINHLLTPIISCALPTNSNSAITIFGQVILNVNKVGTYELIYAVDNVEQEFKPKQVISETGYHILNVFYTLNKETAADNTALDIILKSTSGTADVAVGNCIVNILSSGIGAIHDEATRLSINEDFEKFTFSVLDLGFDLTDSIETEL